MPISLFQTPVSMLHSGLLSGSADIHCHVLPAVDDGINDYHEATIALRWLHNAGIQHLYLTPHVMSDFPENNSVYLPEKFDRFIKQLENDGITDIPALKLGAEYMLEATFNWPKDESLLTYAGRHVLVETSYLTPPYGFKELLGGLTVRGYSPVLAHPERYHYMDGNDYETLKLKNIKFQLNYLSLTGVYGTHVKEKAVQLLKEGMYDYTGSDLHHLAPFRKSIHLKKLTQKLINQLRPLFQNNRQLW